MLAQLNASARMLALAGLHSQYPQASESELRRKLASLLLGKKNWRAKCTETCLMQNEPVEVTLKVTEVFEKLGVPYLIVGSLASLRHGANDTGFGHRRGNARRTSPAVCCGITGRILRG